MWSTSIRIVLSPEEREELERRARSLTAPHRDVVGAQIVLRFADGQTVTRIAAELHRGRRIVHKWGERFEKNRLAGLLDEPRRGRPARFSHRSSCAPGEARV
ncbi:MAG: helix-turn-helix domain-containing protein [Polyangiaceae bacterium]|jgi:hypothetical protein|nr:helix-turn-helix domain-containing protein [Polyangiaceae bacterium]